MRNTVAIVYNIHDPLSVAFVVNRLLQFVHFLILFLLVCVFLYPFQCVFVLPQYGHFKGRPIHYHLINFIQK